ncbi:MAG: hypothetical protein E6K56_03240 [Ignavibacteria bacterium]|nr:MAG: hypothetical protein E6K56_03240 [Ignavibacteria bacterium]
MIKIDASAPIAQVHDYVSSIVEEHLKEWRNGNGHRTGFTRGAEFNRSSEASKAKSDRSEGKSDRSEGKSEPDPFTALVKHSFPGRLVVIEGSDKIASTMQTNLIYNELLTEGYDVRLASLGNSWIGIKLTRKALRKTSLSLPAKVFLAASEIALYYEQLIIPALESGALVIMDGYLSSLYAEGVTNGFEPGWFKTMFHVFHIKPDLTFFLDDALARVIAKRSPPRSIKSPNNATRTATNDSSADAGIAAVYRALAGRDGWQRIPVTETGKEPHQHILADLRPMILPALQQGETITTSTTREKSQSSRFPFSTRRQVSTASGSANGGCCSIRRCSMTSDMPYRNPGMKSSHLRPSWSITLTQSPNMTKRSSQIPRTFTVSRI